MHHVYERTHVDACAQSTHGRLPLTDFRAPSLLTTQAARPATATQEHHQLCTWAGSDDGSHVVPAGMIADQPLCLIGTPSHQVELSAEYLAFKATVLGKKWEKHRDSDFLHSTSTSTRVPTSASARCTSHQHQHQYEHQHQYQHEHRRQHKQPACCACVINQLFKVTLDFGKSKAKSKQSPGAGIQSQSKAGAF